VKDLDPDIKQEVVDLCQKAIDQADLERYEASNRTLEKVYELIPEPKVEWKAYTWMQASRADNYFELQEFQEALDLFEEALLKDADYQENGYIQMRIGQCLHQSKRIDEAIIYLTKAYALGGEDLFEDEYAIYKKLAKQL